jgi:hypothetical protein
MVNRENIFLLISMSLTSELKLSLDMDGRVFCKPTIRLCATAALCEKKIRSEATFITMRMLRQYITHRISRGLFFIRIILL